MLYVKDDGVWKSAREVYAKVGGIWQRASKISTKVNGGLVTAERVPDNVIILYNSSSTANPGLLCDGSNGTPNLLNKALAVDNTAALQLGGNDTHSALEHGTFTWSLGNVVGGDLSSYHILDYHNQMTHYNPNPSHLHSGGTFTLADSINLSKVGFTNLVPRMGGLYIEKDAIILSLSTLTTSFLAQIALNYFLRMASTIGEIAPAVIDSHIKTGLEETSAVATWSVYEGVFKPNYQFCSVHCHNAGATAIMGHDLIIMPREIRLGTFSTTQPIPFNQLPSGACILVTNNNLPSGYSWVDLSSLPRGLVRSTTSNYGVITGDTTHIHSYGGQSPLNAVKWLESRYGPYASTAPDIHYHQNNHNHSINIAVSSAGNSMPAYVTLRLAKKN